MKIEFDVVVIGAGPSGLSAAYVLAKKGLKVAVIEKGEYPGSKSVMGGVLYMNPLKELIPDVVQLLKESKAVERNVIEQSMWLVNENSVLKIGHRNKKWKERPNAFTVLRANFDRWFAKQVEAVGALVIPKTKVEDFIKNGDGKIIGVKTTRPEGDVYCKAVVVSEGVNPLLTMKAGLRKKDIGTKDVAVAVKEIVDVPEAVVNNLFKVEGDFGATIEILGSWSEGMVGIGFLYANRDSISIGCGVLIEDLKRKKVKPYELLENMKNHPAIADLLGDYRNTTKEYLAHLIPEGGYYAMPKVYGDRILVCGDAAMLVNSVHREGSNHAITSGRLAGETLLEAFEKGDFSEKTLKSYYDRLNNSFIIKDLYKYKDLTDTIEKNRHFIEIYPDMLNNAVTKFLDVDGTPKGEGQLEILNMIRKNRSLGGLTLDALKLWKSVR